MDLALKPEHKAFADEVRARISGAVFVAHNARFDYGFLKYAYARLGREFTARVLCTVRLSRGLYPQHRRHNLDTLMERFRLDCSARHRALGIRTTPKR